MWGSQTFGYKPDIVTCAKGLSSAYAPISAVLMSENISKEVEKQAIKLGQFGHGYTYSGHLFLPCCLKNVRNYGRKRYNNSVVKT